LPKEYVETSKKALSAALPASHAASPSQDMRPPFLTAHELSQVGDPRSGRNCQRAISAGGSLVFSETDARFSTFGRIT
jgi:hypothetical protein